MASRSLDFFMTPTEFESVVIQIQKELGLYLVLVKFFGASELSKDGVRMSDGSLPDEIFLTVQKPEMSQISTPNIEPGKWGWVQCFIPKIDATALYKMSLGIKLDWYDAEQAQVFENPTGLELFKKIKPFFQKRLKNPITVTNISTGASEDYNNIWYTKGVEEWVAQGGELMEEGVVNLRYHIQKT